MRHARSERLWILLAGLLLFVATPSWAMQGEPVPDDPPEVVTADPVPAQFNSPQATMGTFRGAAAASRWREAADCLALPDLIGNDAAHEIAQYLSLVLTGLDNLYPSWPPRKHLDVDSELPAGLKSVRFFPDPFVVLDPTVLGEIVIERQEDGRWLFSEATCNDMKDLLDRLKELPGFDVEIAAEDMSWTLWIENQLPASLTSPEAKVLGLKYWQWMGLFLLILLGVALDHTVRGFLVAIARRVIRRKGGTATAETLKRTVRPFGLFVAAIFWLYTLHLLGFPPAALKFLLPAVKLFAMLASVWAAFRLTDLFAEVLAGKAEQTSTKVDDLLVPLLRKTLKVFISALGLIYIADAFDVEILPLLTGLGIGSLAFAFAAKDTIENFFGSIAVITDRPFEVGDWVLINDVEGTVEDLGFRSTRIRTFYNSLVTVPNSTLVRATVDNYGRRKYRRWRTHLNITYDTPPDTIVSFCEGIRELIRVHPYTRKDYFQVWLHQFGPHSLDILIYAFHEAPDWQTELRERERLMLDIIRLANHLGVEFAFPTQTLHMFNEEASAQTPPAEESEGDTTGRAQRDGRLAVRKITAEAAWRREKPGAYKILHAPEFASADGDGDETQIESKVGGE